MNKFFFLILITSQFTFGQDSIKTKQTPLYNTNYKDFIIKNDNVYATTKGDSLITFNIKNSQKKFISSDVIALAKNSKNILFFSKKNGDIFEINQSKTILTNNVNATIYNILFDKKDGLIVITEKYILYKNEKYSPKKDSPMYRKSGRRWSQNYLIKFDVLFLDNSDRIWFGYDAGEWGGDTCFFDLNTKEFYCDETLDGLYYYKYGDWSKDYSLVLKEFPDKIKIIETDTLIKFPHNIYSSNLKGVTQDISGNFFISESLMHFSVNSSLTKLEKTKYNDFYKRKSLDSLLLYEYSYTIFDEEITQIETEYLGPIKYNTYDNSIWYYSQNGFYKIIENNNEYSKKIIFKPKILWKGGLSDAVGYQMNVLKFDFIDTNKIIYLTSLNGIGYYNGKNIQYFK